MRCVVSYLFVHHPHLHFCLLSVGHWPPSSTSRRSDRNVQTTSGQCHQFTASNYLPANEWPCHDLPLLFWTADERNRAPARKRGKSKDGEWEKIKAYDHYTIQNSFSSSTDLWMNSDSSARHQSAPSTPSTTVSIEWVFQVDLNYEWWRVLLNRSLTIILMIIILRLITGLTLLRVNKVDHPPLGGWDGPRKVSRSNH